jgi:long-chain fatty acid transport protein
MKNLSLMLCFCLLAVSAIAQHDNLSNLSAEWVRTPARNAATDANDIVVYNPAGLVRLNDGFHINMGNQSLFRKPSHTFDFGLGGGEKTYTQDGNDLFLPNLYMTYKKDKFALFTGVFMAGGGATANYPTGSITTELIGLQVLTAAQGAYGAYDNQSLKASSFYLTTTLGGSYAVNDMISFSVAGRFIDATNKTQAGLTMTQSPVMFPDARYEFKTTESATGFGGVFSMMVQASPRTRFTARYESAVKLDFETKTHKDDLGMTTDGSKSRRDLPSVIAIGTAFAATPTVMLYGDFNYYSQTSANWGKSTMATEEKNYGELAGNAMGFNIASTFQTGKNFLFSVGGGYTDFQYDDRNGYFTKAGAFETAPDDNFNINTGISYTVSNSVTLTAAYMHTFYKDQTVDAVLAQPLNVQVQTSNSLDVFAIGADIKF